MNNTFYEQKRAVLRSQLAGELTESIVYARLSGMVDDLHNREVLAGIGQEEQKHAGIISTILDEGGHPNLGRVSRILLSAKIFGLTFALKFMENGESKAGPLYRSIIEDFPQLKEIAAEEDAHEAKLIAMLNDDRLSYMGAMVYGLNDALVELTGTLAGFSIAFTSTRVIAMTGLITGAAAGMSMAAAAYLSAKADADKTGLSPFKSAAYTAVAYFITVLFLIIPYLLAGSVFLALGLMLGAAVLVIAMFTFYISVAKGTSFKAGFLEMLSISSIVAAISFGIGYALNKAFGV